MKVWRKAGIGILLIAGIAGAVTGVKAFKKNPQIPPAVTALQTGLKSKGPETAKIILAEYSDFQCPACSMGVSIIRELMAKYPDKIRVIYRHFPLQQHVWAPLVHQSAECAHVQGKFWEYHDLIFQTQKEWSGPANPTAKLLGYAKSLGLDVNQMGACLSDPKIAARVSDDRNQGALLQVSSTPTFFLNGERLVGPVELKNRGEAVIRTLLGLPPLPPPPPAPPAETPKPAGAGTAPQGGEALMTPAGPPMTPVTGPRESKS